MKRLRILPIAVCCLSLWIGGAGCGNSTKQPSRSYEELLIGKWRFTEINNGVIYSATFHPDHRLTQHYKSEQGGGKDRPGEWSIKGDTLVISERAGESMLLFEQLNDSVLSLLTLDSIPVVFERVMETKASAE